MRIFQIFLLIPILFCNLCLAQAVIEPESCVLNALAKGNQSAKNEVHVIRHSCIKIYLKATEGKAVLINQSMLSQLSLAWFPKLQAVGPPYYLNESVRVDIKNNSNSKLLYIVINITNKETSKYETYKLYADSPIEPYSVGFFSGSVITDTETMTMEQFIEKYSWSVVGVYGLTK